MRIIALRHPEIVIRFIYLRMKPMQLTQLPDISRDDHSHRAMAKMELDTLEEPHSKEKDVTIVDAHENVSEVVNTVFAIAQQAMDGRLRRS